MQCDAVISKHHNHALIDKFGVKDPKAHWWQLSMTNKQVVQTRDTSNATGNPTVLCTIVERPCRVTPEA